MMFLISHVLPFKLNYWSFRCCLNLRCVIPLKVIEFQGKYLCHNLKAVISNLSVVNLHFSGSLLTCIIQTSRSGRFNYLNPHLEKYFVLSLQYIRTLIEMEQSDSGIFLYVHQVSYSHIKQQHYF